MEPEIRHLVLPKPKPKESEQDWLERCLGNEQIKNEFGEGTDQATAVCTSIYERNALADQTTFVERDSDEGFFSVTGGRASEFGKSLPSDARQDFAEASMAIIRDSPEDKTVSFLGPVTQATAKQEAQSRAKDETDPQVSYIVAQKVAEQDGHNIYKRLVEYEVQSVARHAQARCAKVSLEGPGEIRTFMGKEHLVVPVIMLREGIHHAVNAPAPEFVPVETLEHHADGWNGRPIVLNHPEEGGPQLQPTPLKHWRNGPLAMFSMPGWKIGP